MKKNSRNASNQGFKKIELQKKSSQSGSELEPLLHSEHTVQIEKLVVGGDGLARIEFKQKSLVVFVPQSAPGDVLQIKIVAAEKNHLLGEILSIEKPSPSRQQAPCVYFNNCGGCNWQHIHVSEQLHQKELILKDLFEKFVPDLRFQLQKSVSTDRSLRYRNRIQLKQQGNAFGYFKRSTHEIVDITDCLLAEEDLAKNIGPVKAQLRPSQELKKFELRLNHKMEFEHYPIGEDGEGLSFSQVNRFVNDELIQSVLSLIKKINPQFMTELYAGAGNFTFPLLDAVPNCRIEAVELNSKLTEFAVKKLTQKNLQKRLHFFTANCESFVARRALSQELVLLDPPRAGCSEDVLKGLCKTSAQNLIYVSCHPVRLVRDLQYMLKSGLKYEIRHLQIFDMFPQTDHFETLVWLSKSDS